MPTSPNDGIGDCLQSHVGVGDGDLRSQPESASGGRRCSQTRSAGGTRRRKHEAQGGRKLQPTGCSTRSWTGVTSTASPPDSKPPRSAARSREWSSSSSSSASSTRAWSGRPTPCTRKPPARPWWSAPTCWCRSSRSWCSWARFCRRCSARLCRNNSGTLSLTIWSTTRGRGHQGVGAGRRFSTDNVDRISCANERTTDGKHRLNGRKRDDRLCAKSGLLGQGRNPRPAQWLRNRIGGRQDRLLPARNFMAIAAEGLFLQRRKFGGEIAFDWVDFVSAWGLGAMHTPPSLLHLCQRVLANFLNSGTCYGLWCFAFLQRETVRELYAVIEIFWIGLIGFCWLWLLMCLCASIADLDYWKVFKDLPPDVINGILLHLPPITLYALNREFLLYSRRDE